MGEVPIVLDVIPFEEELAYAGQYRGTIILDIETRVGRGISRRIDMEWYANNICEQGRIVNAPWHIIS